MAKSIYEGYANGHNEIRGNWTRQWTAIYPDVEPVAINDGQNGTLEVIVHQKVEDLDGNMIFGGIVKHIYTLQDGLLQRMEIEAE
jgi:hypothetical protein